VTVPPRWRALLVGVGIAVAIAGAAAIRVMWQGHTAAAAGDAARAAGDVDGAIAHWRDAARHYLPFAEHVDHAYAQLATTARAADAAGDPAVALAAWQAIRSASRATSGLTTPAGDLAAEADRRIAALRAADPLASPAAGATPAAREAWHAAQLAARAAPSPALAALAALGLALWIGGLVWFARRPAAVRLAAVAAGAALWSIAMIAF
jgi:hypothetical protein